MTAGSQKIVCTSRFRLVDRDWSSLRLLNSKNIQFTMWDGSGRSDRPLFHYFPGDQQIFPPIIEAREG